jgi:small GTP-binding protein
MLQKKICMVGVFGTGKTALVQRFVHSIFSARYLSTVGVKIDRKEIAVNGQPVMLLLWDLEGRDDHHDINPSYLRGAHGLIYVVDGTRRETCSQMFEIRDVVTAQLGAIPSVVAINKTDLTDQWQLTAADEAAVDARGIHRIRTSAKTGEGVEAMFQWLAAAAVGGNGATR